MTTQAHAGHHPHPNYVLIFVILSILTAVSFWTVSTLWIFEKSTGPTVVMIVAVCKAALVAMFFMHLKYDWFKLYYMIVPALVLGTIAVCALLPDMTFSQTRVVDGRVPPAVAAVGN